MLYPGRYRWLVRSWPLYSWIYRVPREAFATLPWQSRDISRLAGAQHGGRFAEEITQARIREITISAAAAVVCSVCTETDELPIRRQLAVRRRRRERGLDVMSLCLRLNVRTETFAAPAPECSHIEDENVPLIDNLLVHRDTVCDGGGNGLVDESEHVQSADCQSILGGLSLVVVEVNRNRNYCICDRLTQIRLSCLHLGENHGRYIPRSFGKNVFVWHLYSTWIFGHPSTSTTLKGQSFLSDVVRLPWSLAMISTLPCWKTATQEYAVPRSIRIGRNVLKRQTQLKNTNFYRSNTNQLCQWYAWTMTQRETDSETRQHMSWLHGDRVLSDSLTHIITQYNSTIIFGYIYIQRHGDASGKYANPSIIFIPVYNYRLFTIHDNALTTMLIALLHVKHWLYPKVWYCPWPLLFQ